MPPPRAGAEGRDLGQRKCRRGDSHPLSLQSFPRLLATGQANAATEPAFNLLFPIQQKMRADDPGCSKRNPFPLSFPRDHFSCVRYPAEMQELSHSQVQCRMHRGTRELGGSGGFLFQLEGLFGFFVWFFKNLKPRTFSIKGTKGKTFGDKTISSGKAFALLWKLETGQNWRDHAMGSNRAKGGGGKHPHPNVEICTSMASPPWPCPHSVHLPTPSMRAAAEAGPEGCCVLLCHPLPV